jgi:putative FmdB family regulatory protein
MPIYEFRCLACNHIFELLSLAQNDTVELQCPQCQAPEVERVLSRVSHVMGSSSGSPKTSVTSKSCSGGSCATIDIPGPSR